MGKRKCTITHEGSNNYGFFSYKHACFHCLDSHSDGTYSLQMIHYWTNYVMLLSSKSVLMKNQINLHLGWPEVRTFKQIFNCNFFGVNCLFINHAVDIPWDLYEITCKKFICKKSPSFTISSDSLWPCTFICLSISKKLFIWKWVFKTETERIIRDIVKFVNASKLNVWQVYRRFWPFAADYKFSLHTTKSGKLNKRWGCKHVTHQSAITYTS